MRKTKLNVNELEIVLYRKDEEEFIFKDIEFDAFRNESGLNSFTLTHDQNKRLK